MKTPSQEIDDIIRNISDWRGRTLAQLRSLIISGDLEVVEEVKWVNIE